MTRAAHRPRRWLLVAAALLIGALAAGAAPAPALGHAAFLGSSPQPGTRLESSPRQIAMTFTEPLNGEAAFRPQWLPRRLGAAR